MMHPHDLDCFLRGITGRRPPDTYVGRDGWRWYWRGSSIFFGVTLFLVVGLFVAGIIGLWEWLT